MVSSASAKNQSALSAGSPSKVFFGRFAPNNPPDFFFGVVALDFFFGAAVDDLDLSEKFGEISGNYIRGLKNFVHCPKHMEGIKQTGVKEKILKFLE